MTISGTGWLPGETVTLNLHRDTNDPPDTVLYAVADANGNITNSEYVCQEHDLNVTFLLTATGQTSGYTAQTTFTDANLNPCSLFRTSVTVKSPKATAPFTRRTFPCGGNTSTCVVTLSVDAVPALPAGAVGHFGSPIPTTTSNVNFSTLTIHGLDRSTPIGTFPFAARVRPRVRACLGGNPTTANGTLVVNAAANTPPTVAADSAAVSFNEGTAASNTGTYSDPNVGQNVLITASVGTVTKTGTNSGTWSWSLPTADGPSGPTSVTITANDGAGGITTTNFTYAFENVAPTATFANNGPISEGGSATVSFTAPSDPSTADNGAGFHYAFSCTNGDLSGSTYAGSGTATSTSCPFDDNGTFPVKGRIIDKDNGFTEYTTTVVVNNVAPTGTFAGSTSVNEGASATYSFSAQSDPSTADTTAGFHYQYSCDGSALPAVNYGASSTSASVSCTFPDGPATVTVRGRIIDKDNGFTDYMVSVTVNNVAPTVPFTTAPAAANEGETKNYVYTVSDPGVDTFTVAAGFPTCGAGNTVSNATTNAGGGSFDCTFNDGPQTPNVSIQVNDSDGAPSNVATQAVTVSNVPPTATFNASSPVNEGSAISLSLTAASDPSSTDTTAGFQYAFDCGDGGGYGAYSVTSTASCATNDNGMRTVKGKIKDQDGDESEYSATVVVDNVAPTAALANDGPVNEGSPATISFSGQFDPSSVDTAAGFHYAFSCSGGSLAGATYSGSGATSATSCTFPDNGSYSVTGRIIDKDGGFTDYSTTVTVTNVPPTLTAPADQTGAEGTDASYSLGSFSDPGTADAPWTVDVNWGDSNTDNFTTGAQGSISHNHTYSDSGTYTVTVTVKDKDNASSNTITFQVTVSNAAPTATLANNGPVNEGSPVTVAFSNQADSSSDDTAAGFHYAYSCSNGDLSAATYATSGTNASTTCTFDDNGTYTVKARIIDKDDGFTEYTTVVTVDNVAPTASLNNNGPVNEGSPATISFTGQFDPSSADTTAGFHYAYACDNGDLSGSSYALGSLSASTTCTFVDNGTYTVRARIIDKDDGFTEYTTVVTVNNVVPTVTAPANQSSDEGENKSFSLGSFSDPGTADNPWTVNVNWGDSTPPESFAVAAQGAISRSHTYDDNGTYTVTYTVTDKDGGVSTPASTFQVTVNNVAPTATLANDGPINEGGSVNVTFSAASDPSNADTSAGFHYAYSCTNGDLSAATYAGSGASPTTSCTFNDNGTFTVKARIIDKDGGFTEYTTDVTVNNVAPTAVLSNNGPVDEGSPATITFTAQFDPSSDDTAAGFHYAYSCSNGDLSGATYAGSGTSPSSSCTFPDNGTFLVKARIIDKDGGFSEYTTSVVVNNVPPTLTSPGDQTGNEGVEKLFDTGSFSDPGTADAPWTVDVNWGDSNTDSFTTGTQGATSHNHTYADSGTYTVTVTVKDKDNASSNTITFQVTVTNTAPTADLANNGPVNEGSPATVTFSNQFDPSATDTAAGFHYAYSCSNGDLSGATYAGSGTNASTTCTFDDNGTYTVKARIIDKDDGFTEYTTVVTVDNVAPTASLSNNGPVNEGSPATISFSGQFDPSSADTAAGFHYAYACDNGDLSGVNYALGSTSASSTCTFIDNGTYTVRARIIDKDDGFTEYTTVVTVNNVVPTVTPPANQSSDEGENKSFSLGSFSDPGTADNPWTVNVNWGDSTPPESFAVAAQGAISRNHTYDDNGTYTVTYTVTDKDGGVSTPASTFLVTVSNVAPTATLANDGPINEGGSVNVTFSNQLDPSNADTTAGFHYAYSCTNGDLSAATYAGSGTSPTTSCTFNDNGTHTVKARIIDKDGGFTEYTTDVTVNNIAPTAVLSNNGPVGEGSPATITFSAQFDPSSDDTAAGFHYAYACDNGDLSGATYTGSGTSPSTTCTYSDNGTYTVKARIIDKDDGFTEYTTVVTVNNVVPTVTAPANQSSDEGENKSFSLGSFSDLGTADNPWTVNVNWGDSTPPESFAVAAQGAISRSHTYDDNGTYTVTYTVTDKDGGVSTPASTFQVTVNNVDPTATLSNDGPVDEGAPATVSFSGQSDPSSADTTAGFHYAFSCTNGDLSGATYAGSGTSASTTCSFADNGSHTVKARIIDKDGGFTEYTTVVVVNNSNPAVGAVGVSPEPSLEGSSATASASFTDTGSGDTHTCSINWGDGFTTSGTVTEASGNGSCSGSHTYLDNGSFTVTITITDDDAGAGSASTTHVVNNVAPTVGTPVVTPGTINENDTATLTGSFTDPGTLDGHTVVISWGDGSANTTLTLAPGVLTYSTTHQYKDDNPTATSTDVNTITVTVTDKDGAPGSNGTTITVNNLAPVVTSVTGPVGPVALGNPITITATFTDVGTQDTHTCTVNWDDTSTTPGVVTETNGSGSCSATHTYAAAGVYSITVTVTDDDGGSGSKSYDFSFAVIYDPNGGFVTGGGWITSAPGSYPDNGSATGKANFGFVSKYQTGKNATSNVPTGETEFQFKAGDLNFHSSAYDGGSLVISGYKATYRGTGTINGAGSYKFLVIAYDGQRPGGNGVDRFRIKITTLSGGVVYDNRMGSSEDPDLSDGTALGGGSIVIHKN